MAENELSYFEKVTEVATPELMQFKTKFKKFTFNQSLFKDQSGFYALRVVDDKTYEVLCILPYASDQTIDTY